MNAAMFIAYNGTEDAPVSGSAIVEHCNLNKRALEPVLQRLSSADIIVSVKGAKGGYYMQHPERTTLGDVAQAFVTRIVSDKHDFAGYDDLIDDALDMCYESWLDSLSDVSFKHLCRRAKQSGQIMPVQTPVLNFAI